MKRSTKLRNSSFKLENNVSPVLAGNQLVYLVYGSARAYRLEAKFSILTALRQLSGTGLRILLYTDEPGSYAGWPVEVVALDQNVLAEWTGPQGYLHRRKAIAIRNSLSLADKSIFIDTDTFFLKSPVVLFGRLEKSSWLVDEIEGVWGGWDDQPLYKALAGYLDRHYSVRDDMRLINSGVLGLCHEDIPLMDGAISLIDELYPLASDIHIIEQFAVGVAAYHDYSAPAEACDVVRHYYGEKPFWHAMLEKFFQKYGEDFCDSLPSLTSEVPQIKPKPAPLKRLELKIKNLLLPKEYRAAARLLSMAVNLSGDEYAQACAPVYASALIAKAPKLADQLLSGCWPKAFSSLFSSKDRDRIINLLNGKKINSGAR